MTIHESLILLFLRIKNKKLQFMNLWFSCFLNVPKHYFSPHKKSPLPPGGTVVRTDRHDGFGKWLYGSLDICERAKKKDTGLDLMCNVRNDENEITLQRNGREMRVNCVGDLVGDWPEIVTAAAATTQQSLHSSRYTAVVTQKSLQTGPKNGRGPRTNVRWTKQKAYVIWEIDLLSSRYMTGIVIGPIHRGL